ncbi:hypothetical protein VHEMI00002 [[Torrubiella] hemipterigena]|uniref:Uncharacterized protein n=1 Tax=[Torrubiella] hemipterigena TaxID=1531966 RepID=A0A0A1T0L2_9HYPO|nr:hypothetical protein VHEMI00002 [[Torrubiella] hemipterigena]
MQISIAIITAALAASVSAAPAADAQLAQDNVIESFPIETDWAIPEGVEPFSANGGCRYFVQEFEGKSCTGNSDPQFQASSDDCQELSGNRRGSFIIRPIGDACTAGHADFYKNASPAFCSGGVKFHVDFRGATCVTPANSHPYDSFRIRT